MSDERMPGQLKTPVHDHGECVLPTVNADTPDRWRCACGLVYHLNPLVRRWFRYYPTPE